MHDEDLDRSEARSLARALRDLFEAAGRVLPESTGDSPLVAKVCDHLGCGLPDVLAVAKSFPPWEHVNLQRGVDTYLAAHTPEVEWYGPTGSHRGHEDLMGILSAADQHLAYGLGAADYGTEPIGPDEHTEVVTLGLVNTVAPDGSTAVLAMRGSDPFGMPFTHLDVLAAARETATAVRDEVLRLMEAGNVFRGQVLSFSESEHHGNELVTFLPRPDLTAEQVVLPDGLLDSVENHVVSISDYSEQLRAAGQHLKRGLLLHGPPGTGKTHTVRYLIGRLPGRTVLLLTGRALGLIEQAAVLARRLQPSIVVLEDVDLVATDRDFSPDGNPLLFTLLDAMDGVGSDADVAFVLTTNRADILEPALTDRPGRIDLAMEIPRPDETGRLRLLRLYAPGLAAGADLAPVLAASEGVTASFIKELVRRTVLIALRADDDPRALRADQLMTAVEEMNDERQALTRSLLGAAGSGRPPVDPDDPDDLEEVRYLEDDEDYEEPPGPPFAPPPPRLRPMPGPGRRRPGPPFPFRRRLR